MIYRDSPSIMSWYASRASARRRKRMLEATRRAAIAFVIAFLLTGATFIVTSRAVAAEGFDSSDTLNAIHEASVNTGVSEAWIYRTVRCETGATFDPYAVGRQGEQGAAQLAPWGELRRFYSLGFDNPWNPYQAVEFLAERFAAGGSGAWTCA